MTATVLIVDDSLTVRMDLVEAFRDAGFRALGEATIAGARSALRVEAIDVVVLDVLLPDGDGVELLRDLRASPGTASTIVLMLSTESEVKDRLRGLATGADEYVGKPYDLHDVVARTRALVRARRSTTAADHSHILLIDDSATFANVLRQRLEQDGYGVVIASSGEEGLRLAAAQRPHAIVVDGVLPGIDGATVIRRARLDAALRGVPCLLLTASEDRGAELSALDAGADAFVRKGDDIDVILARIGAMLRGTLSDSLDATESALSPKRILAVDDSATYLHTLAAALGIEGYDVVLAHSGAEALDLLAAQAVDCILLDVMMPGLSGQETCRRIKAVPAMREIPLIMLTALEDRDAMLDGLGAGADDYIAKSGEFEVLRARVRAQIRRKQFEDEHRRVREELLRTNLSASEARAARELAETRSMLVEELERKNSELEAFSYSVSHDLRAPLRSIDGFSHVLLEEYASVLDATGQNYLQRVRAAAQRMGELIDDMLELSRVGRAELRRETVDLSQLARHVAAELQRANPERSVGLAIQDGLCAEGDERLLRIVIENLLGNAWKFTSKETEPCVEVGGDAAPDWQTFFVRDNGAGFDMTYAAKLFQPFQRLHSTDDYPGTGIGLATIHRVIDRHGGRVWAEGVEGTGATFRFTLPTRAGGRT